MATKYRRVTVTLPAKLVEGLDHKLTEPDETRSAAIRRLVNRALREAKDREDEERWVQGYLEQPQTDEELAWADLVEDADPAHVPPW
jgi:metal-responsive CopG/Arc/MetJ family transcriptional regulator